MIIKKLFKKRIRIIFLFYKMSKTNNDNLNYKKEGLVCGYLKDELGVFKSKPIQIKTAID